LAATSRPPQGGRRQTLRGKTLNILMEDVSDYDYIVQLLDEFVEEPASPSISRRSATRRCMKSWPPDDQLDQ
jgi:hypothetical protein